MCKVSLVPGPVVRVVPYCPGSWADAGDTLCHPSAPPRNWWLDAKTPLWPRLPSAVLSFPAENARQGTGEGSSLMSPRSPLPGHLVPSVGAVDYRSRAV